MSRSIGIFAGTFDPVHQGHLAFVQTAAENLGLDRVFFLPEQEPRGKQGVSGFDHRVAMLELALKDRPKLEVLVLPHAQFDVDATLPLLRDRFVGDELTLLLGSDVARGLPTWPGADELLAAVGLAVGVRAGDDETNLKHLLPRVVFVRTPYAHIAASQVRSKGSVKSVDPSVAEYIARHRLYGS